MHKYLYKPAPLKQKLSKHVFLRAPGVVKVKPVLPEAPERTINFEILEDTWHTAKRKKDIDTIINLANDHPDAYKQAACEYINSTFEEINDREYWKQRLK